MAAEEQSPLLATAISLIDGYNSWSMDAIMAPRAPNCTQKVYPLRLDRPAMGNDEYRQYFVGVMDQFKDYHLEILEATEDTKQHRVVFHLQGTAKTAIGDYANEFFVSTQMTEDDGRIVEIKEFVDSGYSMEFFAKLRAYMAGQS
ncbi:hypothetical protein LTR09_002312 [Extremus antarcticus]|uniref:SnoaL-like domain-containing protein n=1 Tax=Extremus antarcticus TaxID=702011 RepID=A0AAJ0GFH3_9PEZI|nr:hypothetical protein LTR09_002312 [Extremus antarcticus]